VLPLGVEQSFRHRVEVSAVGLSKYPFNIVNGHCCGRRVKRQSAVHPDEPCRPPSSSARLLRSRCMLSSPATRKTPMFCPPRLEHLGSDISPHPPLPPAIDGLATPVCTVYTQGSCKGHRHPSHLAWRLGWRFADAVEVSCSN